MLFVRSLLPVPVFFETARQSLFPSTSYHLFIPPGSPNYPSLADEPKLTCGSPCCSAEVVPGDIVNLKMGDTVPADVRLFDAMNLNCDESMLTGESIAVEKRTANDILVPGTDELVVEDTQVGAGDRVNLAYATTIVRKGRGRGIVYATGMSTEVGKIAASSTKKDRKAGRSMNWKKYGPTQPIKGGFRRTYDFLGKFLGLTEGTPLQIKLAKLAYFLFFCALFLAVIVFSVNRWQLPLPIEVIIYAISTGIAIIPESLVAVLTITMVVATTVMRKANVVVRYVYFQLFVFTYRSLTL